MAVYYLAARDIHNMSAQELNVKVFMKYCILLSKYCMSNLLTCWVSSVYMQFAGNDNKLVIMTILVLYFLVLRHSKSCRLPRAQMKEDTRLICIVTLPLVYFATLMARQLLAKLSNMQRT